MEDEFVLTLSDIFLFLVANTVVSGLVGFALEYVLSRAFAQRDGDAERAADAQERTADAVERIADAFEEQNLARAIEGKVSGG